MTTIPRLHPLRKPRFYRWREVAVGWRRDDEILWFCRRCAHFHVALRDQRAVCLRKGTGGPTAIMVCGAAPEAILKADARNRIGSHAQQQLDWAFFWADYIIDTDDLPAPTLPAFRYTDLRGLQHLIVHCPYCEVWHRHGIGPTPGSADGPRAPHCFCRWSPFLKSGYRLVEVAEATAEIGQDARRKKARGLVCEVTE